MMVGEKKKKKTEFSSSPLVHDTELVCDPLSINCTNNWQLINCTAKDGIQENFPSPRCGHSITILGDNMFVFGGLAIENIVNNTEEGICHRLSNDLFILRMCSIENTWSKVEIIWEGHPVLPPARWRHTACQINSTEILMFGGAGSMDDDRLLNDVFLFNAITMSWRQPNPSSSKYVNGSHLHNEWSSAPSPRSSHTANVIKHFVYIFGGCGGYGYDMNSLNDLVQLNTKDWVWKEIDTTGKQPEKRFGHSACVVSEHKLLIFGGCNAKKEFNDLFVLDTYKNSFSWTSVECYPSPFPVKRWRHAACVCDETVYIFGGIEGPLDPEDLIGNYRNNIISFSGQESECYTAVYNQYQEDREIPMARADTAMAIYSKESKLVVFGGCSNTFFNDAYMLDIGLRDTALLKHN